MALMTKDDAQAWEMKKTLSKGGMHDVK